MTNKYTHIILRHKMSDVATVIVPAPTTVVEKEQQQTTRSWWWIIILVLFIFVLVIIFGVIGASASKTKATNAKATKTAKTAKGGGGGTGQCKTSGAVFDTVTQKCWRCPQRGTVFTPGVAGAPNMCIGECQNIFPGKGIKTDVNLNKCYGCDMGRVRSNQDITSALACNGSCASVYVRNPGAVEGPQRICYVCPPGYTRVPGATVGENDCITGSSDASVRVNSDPLGPTYAYATELGPDRYTPVAST